MEGRRQEGRNKKGVSEASGSRREGCGAVSAGPAWLYYAREALLLIASQSDEVTV